MDFKPKDSVIHEHYPEEIAKVVRVFENTKPPHILAAYEDGDGMLDVVEKFKKVEDK
jgi:hypothetical protein